VEVAVLLEAPRCVGEGGAGHGSARAAGAELAREQPCAEEAERVGEQEEQVVAEDRGRHPGADRPRRGVAGEGVRERQAVAQRPEGVGLEVVERLVKERVAAPPDLPGLHERVAHVAWHVARHVKRKRPVQREREQAGGQRRKRDLAPREGRTGDAHGAQTLRITRNPCA
jgi:hypothetical protein